MQIKQYLHSNSEWEGNYQFGKRLQSDHINESVLTMTSHTCYLAFFKFVQLCFDRKTLSNFELGMHSFVEL